MTTTEKIDSLISGELFEGKGYIASKDINLRLVWLRAVLDDYSIPIMPPHLQVCSSYKCNYQCKFCGGHGISDERHKKLNTQKDMPHSRLLDILNEVLPSAYTWSVASSGEFFCQPNIKELLNAARPYESRASVTTNGSIMDVDTISAYIPNACSIRVSMASAVKPAYEFFHRHGNFERVVNNIRTLTRAIEIMSPSNNMCVGMYGPILASTMKELSHRVRAVKAMGMQMIGSTSFLLQVNRLAKHDSRWLNEQGELYQGLWNYCRTEASKVAKELNVTNCLHRPFAGVAEDPNCILPEDDLMFPRILEALKKEPPVESVFDTNKIEKNARIIAKNVLSSYEKYRQTPEADKHAQDSLDVLRDVLSRHREDIIKIAGDDKETVRACWRFDLNANILPADEFRPCCVSSYRFKIDRNASISEIYNGKTMRTFSRNLAMGEIPEDCLKCRELVGLKKSKLLAEALKGELLDNVRNVYDDTDEYNSN